MSDASTHSKRRLLFKKGVLVYCTLWAITALFGLPDVDRKFDIEFSVGTQNLAPPGKRSELVPVMRIPFSTELRDLHASVPDKPWRARSSGFAIAPFMIVDEVASQWGPLAGLSSKRLVFWFFGYSEWRDIKTYWLS